MCWRVKAQPLHLVLLQVSLLLSLLSSFCCCTLSHSHPARSYYYNYGDDYYSANNNVIIGEEDNEVTGNYYQRYNDNNDNGDHDQLGLRNFMDDGMEQSDALAPSSSGYKIVSVDDYLGSNQDNADHNEAFAKAWKEACFTTGGVFLVPKNKEYKLRPMNFSGPCHAHFNIKILGSIKASEDISEYKPRTHWLVFENLRNFELEGGGTIDGKGHIWWQNSCKINKTKPCQHAPTALTFEGCKNFRVTELRMVNAQQMHLTFQRCANVRAFNLVIIAPGHSPNTDGIHISQTRNIHISNSLIKTGDDCISIVSGSKNIRATDITCGPGHGISIGSLGAGQSKAHVSNVWVNRARLSGTTNGVRIKTWQGGRGYAKNIIFQNILMQNVSNPIIIDQHYCDQQTPCQDMKSSVQVSNVLYKDIKGTSATDIAIKLDCNKGHRCRGIILQNVKLMNQQQQRAKADCHYVNLVHRGTVLPKCFRTT
ncbi:hypothetical protein Cgig2_014766 [Carnegiea gigantea]|uniref:endo-polygalacturonase n=1 Tax=Carnegiea gigantea TaxID=171969 RepID=A0A9Q1L1X7_9CARY|nr:hypothetical protein Cgig2_014766 [Carnegiea gigantea]